MSKRDIDDLLQFTIKKDGEYQGQLIDVITQKNDEIKRLKKGIEEVLEYLYNSNMSYVDKNEIAIRLKGDKE